MNWCDKPNEVLALVQGLYNYRHTKQEEKGLLVKHNHVLSMTAFTLQQRVEVDATETLLALTPKIFTT